MIGIKDQYRGEAPKAFIKLKAGMTATETDIRKHLEVSSPRSKCPRRSSFATPFPRR